MVSLVPEPKYTILTISEDPPVLALQLGDPRTASTMVGAEKFAKLFKKAIEDYPEYTFQFLPYGYTEIDLSPLSVLCSIMAVGQKK